MRGVNRPHSSAATKTGITIESIPPRLIAQMNAIVTKSIRYHLSEKRRNASRAKTAAAHRCTAASPPRTMRKGAFETGQTGMREPSTL